MASWASSAGHVENFTPTWELGVEASLLLPAPSLPSPGPRPSPKGLDASFLLRDPLERSHCFLIFRGATAHRLAS